MTFAIGLSVLSVLQNLYFAIVGVFVLLILDLTLMASPEARRPIAQVLPLLLYLSLYVDKYVVEVWRMNRIPRFYSMDY